MALSGLVYRANTRRTTLRQPRHKAVIKKTSGWEGKMVAKLAGVGGVSGHERERSGGGALKDARSTWTRFALPR